MTQVSCHQCPHFGSNKYLRKRQIIWVLKLISWVDMSFNVQSSQLDVRDDSPGVFWSNTLFWPSQHIFIFAQDSINVCNLKAVFQRQINDFSGITDFAHQPADHYIRIHHYQHQCLRSASGHTLCIYLKCKHNL